MDTLTLSEQEIIEATGYKLHSKQLAVLRKAGIPADRRPDGSVRVWRHHLTGLAPGAAAPLAEPPKPMLKFQRKAAA